MREKYDRFLRWYYVCAGSASLILLFSQFVIYDLQLIRHEIMDFVVLGFNFYSIAALIHFVKKEFNIQTLLLPIFAIGITVSFYIFVQYFDIITKTGIMFGIIFSMFFLVLSMYNMHKFVLGHS